jgi:hypothetical protein
MQTPPLAAPLAHPSWLQRWLQRFIVALWICGMIGIFEFASADGLSVAWAFGFPMFLSILLRLSRNLTPSLRTHRTCTNRVGDSLFLPFCTIGISLYQKLILPYPFLPFCTIRISMYQKRILPYYFDPQNPTSPNTRCDTNPTRDHILLSSLLTIF